MNIIEINGSLYNLNQFVSLEERERSATDAEAWSGKTPERELVLTFSGGVSVSLPLAERERIERQIRGQVVEQLIRGQINQINWTPRAQQVFALARKHAKNQSHKLVSTGHLLVGLCQLGHGVHLEPLRKQRFDESKCIEDAEKIATKEDASNPDYSKTLLVTVQRARNIATRLNHSFVGTEQLALALLEADDEIGGLLRESYKLDAKKLERDILKELEPDNDQSA